MAAARLGLWLYHGGEPYLVDRAWRATWQRLTAAQDSDLDRELLDPTASVEAVLDAVSSVGFFAAGRVVGVREWRALAAAGGRRKPSADADRMAELLDTIPEGAHVVVSAPGTVPAAHPVLKLARARGSVEEFPALRARDVSDWLGRRVRELKLRIEAPAARLLHQRVGDDLRLLDAELQKLSVYADGGPIRVDDVRVLVPDSAEHQVWAITDALVGDPGLAAAELDRALRAGEPAGRLSYMLVRQLRLLLAASDAPDGQAGIKALTEALADENRPVAEYTVKKAIEQSRGVERSRLLALLHTAGAVEAASRRGELGEEDALRLLVFSAIG